MIKIGFISEKVCKILKIVDICFVGFKQRKY